jgi:molecular chaperone DnaK
MRDTIDFGIDLGTTNSAIAVVGQDGTAVVIKDVEGWDITPSAVWIPGPGEVRVGRRARAKAASDPNNATAEFKLDMGFADIRKEFVKGRVSMTPPQLSAEVLKSLRADAARATGTAPDLAVITVPAAFSLNQNKATLDAAALAGFGEGCPLVQEPTAAAFAYGFNEAQDRGYWMVFDFGGGTFDAAVVSKRDGDLRVLNHAGDRRLGGKDIDWAVVEQILAPAAAQELGLPEFHRENPAWLGNFANLKEAAEQAKIQLTGRDLETVEIELLLPDRSRADFRYMLRRGDFDRVAEPFYVRAMNLCRKALTESGLGPDDIDRLVLVGGTTLAPGLRERLADPTDGIGIPLDTSLDPTTVVARGAAIFASTVRRPQRSFQPAVGEFALQLEYEPSVSTTGPTVAGKLHAAEPVNWTGYGVVLANPEGQPPFRSSRIALNAEGAFATEVLIDPHRTSRFTVEVTDPTGVPQRLAPYTLAITHRTVEFGGAGLGHSLGIQLADRVFSPVLRKGAALPTKGHGRYATTGRLDRSDADAVVRIPVVQGEHARADRNRQVGMLEIRSTDVRFDLPAGTPVEVTFEADVSNMVTVMAEVEIADVQVEAEINLDDVRTPPIEDLKAELDEAKRRLRDVRADEPRSPKARDLLDQLDRESLVQIAEGEIRTAETDPGSAAAAEDRLREAHARLDQIEEAAQLPAAVADLRDCLAEARQVVSSAGQHQDRQQLAELERRAEGAIASGNLARVTTATEAVTGLIMSVERRQPGWAIGLFHALCEMEGQMRPTGQAAALIQEGRRAVAAGDERAVASVNARLARLLPQQERSQVVWVDEL